MELGELLKKTRLEKGCTITDAAHAIGVTAGLISQIENGITSPSIQTLRDILGFYKLPLSVFFRQMEKEDLIAVRADDIETIKGEKGIQVSLLASKLENNALESYLVTITSDEHLEVKETTTKINGERFIYVMKGSIHVSTSRDSLILRKGDSINFKSYISCTIKRAAGQSAEFILNGTPQVL